MVSCRAVWASWKLSCWISASQSGVALAAGGWPLRERLLVLFGVGSLMASACLLGMTVLHVHRKLAIRQLDTQRVSRFHLLG